MTLEELLNNSADELDKLSSLELEKFFEPMLNVSRPERESAVFKSSGNNKKQSKSEMLMDKLISKGGEQKVMELFKDLDIELEDLL